MRSVVLVGFMGCGKSTLAQALAERLRTPFRDGDAELAKRAGRSIAEWIRTEGSGPLRRAETAWLEEALAGPRAVISPGGGAFTLREVREQCRANAETVWVDAPLRTIRRRLSGRSDRPLWPEDPSEQRRMYDRRSAVYRLAGFRFPIDPALDPGALADRLLERWKPREH